MIICLVLSFFQRLLFFWFFFFFSLPSVPPTSAIARHDLYYERCFKRLAKMSSFHLSGKKKKKIRTPRKARRGSPTTQTYKKKEENMYPSQKQKIDAATSTGKRPVLIRTRNSFFCFPHKTRMLNRWRWPVFIPPSPQQTHSEETILCALYRYKRVNT